LDEIIKVKIAPLLLADDCYRLSLVNKQCHSLLIGASCARWILFRRCCPCGESFNSDHYLNTDCQSKAGSNNRDVVWMGDVTYPPDEGDHYPIGDRFFDMNCGFFKRTSIAVRFFCNKRSDVLNFRYVKPNGEISRAHTILGNNAVQQLNAIGWTRASNYGHIEFSQINC
jgi:hypothetical protein